MRLSSISAVAVLIAAPAFAQSAAPSPDAALWASASKGAVGELQLYLGQYPQGPFASQAKAALAALNAGPPASPAPATKASLSSAASKPPKPTPSPAVSKPANLKPGWLVEVRATHQQANSSGQINPSNPWVPDPIALSLKPQPGSIFNVAKLARNNPGAGPLPAIAGSARWLVKQAGQWGIGTNIKWHDTGSCTVTVSVQGNQVIKSTTNQANYWPGSGDTSFSAAVSLTPGIYDVAWAFVCQPTATKLPDKDASLSLLVAPPHGALANPTPGEFVYQPNK